MAANEQPKPEKEHIERCSKCGSRTPIGHRCIVDDLDAIRNADLSDHPLTQAIKNAAPQPESDYTAALASFAYKGGAVRLIEPITDTYERANEWGHAEKDEYTVPFGPWSEPETVSAGPWVWRYGTATAATGSSYRVLATRIHADVAAREGGPVVVTMLSPWSAAYSLSDQGYLDHTYVADKFLGGRSVHGGDLAALTRLIGLLLGRETSADVRSSPGSAGDQ